ncbi:MAG: hypothetical protein HQK51_01510 [Oligoflexia bacterium]|nr:hypothetical protein [Oligoflexia bacterium]
MNKKDQQIYNLALEVIYQRLTIVEFSTLINKSYRPISSNKVFVFIKFVSSIVF